jgi:hypothetical protein
MTEGKALEPITLEGQHVRLEPLSLAHLDDLAGVAFDEELWRWTSERALSPEELRAYVERSRAAIRRIGATEEGTLRKHAITSAGRVRDDVYYGILDDGWPEVKARLEKRLGREDSSPIIAPRTTG